ncbi:MAG: carboxymuconolactone decarboxylase family protein [Rhodospirillaceae bacterium]
MEFLKLITDRIPDHAKDIRLNLGSVLSRSSLPLEAALGVALAAAYAAKCHTIVDAIRASGQMSDTEVHGALSAAALMAMNTVWYPYLDMAGDEDLKTQRAELRMNAYGTHGGIDKQRFELYSLAASIVGKCHFCVRSHYKLLKENGMTALQLRDAGRIAAVVAAAAVVLAVES